MLNKVKKTIKEFNMLNKGDRVVVAVSGGIDSVVLLHALAGLAAEYKLSIIVAHFNHCLRGRESDRDEAFVKRLAGKLGLKFVCKRIDVRLLLKKGDSLQDIAREARYSFFDRVAKRYKADRIATGHNMDDQAETVLMRVIKGASLKGLVGISPSRAEGDLRIVRPIIELEKREIVEYLHGLDVSYRIDHTNLEPIYFRNIVRSDIIPFLEKYNPRLKRVLFNLAEHLREDFEFIEKAKAGARGMVFAAKDGAIEVSLKDLVLQPRVIQKEILRDCLQKAGGEVKKLSFRHWKEVEGLINRKGRGRSVHLPGGITAARGEKSLILSKI